MNFFPSLVGPSPWVQRPAFSMRRVRRLFAQRWAKRADGVRDLFFLPPAAARLISFPGLRRAALFFEVTGHE